MKGITLKQIGLAALEDCAEPKIENSGDAVVRVSTAGICGSDLHILSGRDAGAPLGIILGHEFTGVIEEVGKDVTGFQKGDRVVSPFTTNCGKCFYCERKLPARCVRSEGFGFTIPGPQAEFVRVPLASSTLMKIPPGLADE